MAAIGSPKVVPHLAQMLEDVDWVTRLTAAKGLGRVGSRTCIPHLAKALHDEEWSVRLHAALSLGQIGIKKDAVPALQQTLKDPKGSVRRGACEALAMLGDAGSVDALGALSKDEDDKVQQAAAAPSSIVGDEWAEPRPRK